MKILCAGDQHWTTTKPKNRTDDYYKTVLDKLQQECEIAEEYFCKAIIFPGDLFDSFKENHAITQDIINLFKDAHIQIFCVAGQHDQKFHNNDLRGTALGTLIAAGVVTLLSRSPYFIDSVALYGASWKEEIPEITVPNQVNILVTHRMIVDEKLWAQQEGHAWANHLLIKNKFDLIVSGDNHKRFSASKGSQHLINCGAMLRSSIAQVEHKPAVAVYDTCKNSFEWVELVIKPIDEVMCIEKAEKEKEKNKQLESFVLSLKDAEFGPHGEVRIKLDFVDALTKYIEANEVPDDVADIIYELLEK
jgi:exonuclease SbcD